MMIDRPPVHALLVELLAVRSHGVHRLASGELQVVPREVVRAAVPPEIVSWTIFTVVIYTPGGPSKRGVQILKLNCKILDQQPWNSVSWLRSDRA